MNEPLAGAVARTVSRVIDRLLGGEVAPGRPLAGWPDRFRSDLTGVVGLAGRRLGLLAVHGTREGIRRIAARLTGSPAPSDDEVRDTVGELSNMVAGNLGMNADGLLPPLASSLPTVIEGESYHLRFVGGIDRIIVPFELEGAELLVELVLGQESPAA